MLILTTFDPDENIFEAMRAGASGFILKDAQPSQPGGGGPTVAAGEACWRPPSPAGWSSGLSSAARPPTRCATVSEFAELTERELEVLRLIARGLERRDRRELFLSEATVKPT